MGFNSAFKGLKKKSQVTIDICKRGLEDDVVGKCNRAKQEFFWRIIFLHTRRGCWKPEI